MRTSQTALAVTILWAVFFAFSAAPGMAGESVTSIASVRIGAAGVDWLPHADYDHLVLTVAGPQGLYIQREFRSGEIPSFGALDIQNRHLPDGGYTYELRAISRQEQELLDKLSRAREAGDETALDELRKRRLPESPRAQSGHLWVQGGEFVNLGSVQRDPVNERKPASKPLLNRLPLKDIVQNDDLIVQKQACIGSGCLVGDANVPALKLKELFDTEILFENDGCCNPSTRDWALQANDLANNSGDFLVRDITAGTIPIRIGAATPDNALTLFSTGNIGLGTLTPAVHLDVKTNDAGKATERLQNSSATGYSGTEYLDNAGNVDLFFGLDNANLNTRLSSSNNFPITILTNGTERMRVTSAGNVGIGTTTPGSKLDIVTSAAGTESARIYNTSSTGYPGFGYFGVGGTLGLFIGLDNANGNTRINSVNSNPIVILTNSTERMRITSGGNVGIGTASPTHPLEMASGAFVTTGGVWTNASSRELKRDIHSLRAEDALSTLSALEPVRFHYKAEPADEYLGFIAEDVPDLVATADRKTLSPMDLTAVLTKVVQEQQKAIGDLRATVAILSEKLAAIEQRKENNH